jgi:hypothetical protein
VPEKSRLITRPAKAVEHEDPGRRSGHKPCEPPDSESIGRLYQSLSEHLPTPKVRRSWSGGARKCGYVNALPFPLSETP